MFITFEGGEGSGKTTQINLLNQNLLKVGKAVVVTREPGGCETAENMRELFIKNKGHEWPQEAQATFMFTARQLHYKETIKPALEAGKVVVSDRFTDSTRVYQGVAGGMDMDHLEKIKQISIGDFEPDLTFILDIDPKLGLVRASERGDSENSFEEKELFFHENIREGFKSLAQFFSHRTIILDATREIEDLAEEIFLHTKDRLGPI